MNYLFAWNPQFEECLLKTPETTLPVMEKALLSVAEMISGRKLKMMEINLRRDGWQAESLRSLALQSKKVGQLVNVNGMVVRCKRAGIRYKAVGLILTD